MNDLTTKKPYAPPILEQHSYHLITATILSISGVGLEPMSDFLEEQP